MTLFQEMPGEVKLPVTLDFKLSAEIHNLLKLMVKPLPNYTKKIARPVFVLGVIGFIFSGVLADFFTLEETVVGWILKDLILVSMLLLVFFAEK